MLKVAVGERCKKIKRKKLTSVSFFPCLFLHLSLTTVLKAMCYVLARIFKCRKIRIFCANFLSRNIHPCYFFTLLHLWMILTTKVVIITNFMIFMTKSNPSGIQHSFIIIREVLILTLSIFIPLQRCICLYPLATGMILNEMINSDHNIQSHPCSQRCTDQYCP